MKACTLYLPVLLFWILCGHGSETTGDITKNNKISYREYLQFNVLVMDDNLKDHTVSQKQGVVLRLANCTREDYIDYRQWL